jgi:putative addiction module killer protein
MPEAALELVAYRDVEGREPFQVWFDELDRQAATKVAVVLTRMTQGNLSEVKSVGAGVLERRIDWGPGYRVYFGRDGERLVILLSGGAKKRQQRDIEDAQRRWADYKQRKRGKEAAR